MGPSCEGRPLRIIALLHYPGITGIVSEPIGRNHETISQNGGTHKKPMKIGLGSVAAKSDAILLADTSPRLEEKNPDGLLELELLSLEQRQIRKKKDILTRERITIGRKYLFLDKGWLKT